MRAYCKAGSQKLLLVIPNELALVRADRIQDQPNTDAEAIDEHILFADVSHLFPKFLVFSEYPFSVIGQTGYNLLLQLNGFAPEVAILTSVNDTLLVG